MKIALLICGLPRNVQEGHDYFWKKLIDTYDCDVYYHAWKEEQYDLVKSLYGNNGVISVPMKFTSYKQGISVEDNETNYTESFDVAGYFRSYPLFKSWQSVANLLLNEIIREDKYDLVVRGRFDLYNPYISLNGMDPSKLNISAHNWPGSPICDDNLMVTSSYNFLNLHINIFNDLINYANEHKRIYFQEKNLTNMIEYHGMTHLVHKADQLRFQFVRDIKKLIKS